MKCKSLLLIAAIIACDVPTSLCQPRTRTTLNMIRHADKLDNKNQTVFQTSRKKFEKIEFEINSPKDVSVYIEPEEGTSIVFHPTPGFDFYQNRLAQLSVYGCVSNTGSSQVDLDKVTITYKKGNNDVTKTFNLPSDKLKVDPGYTWCWQNGRDYHEFGDVIFLEAPFPTEATFKFYFKNYTVPITIKKNLKPYNMGLSLPFEKKDLKTNEYWSSYSMHGGGDQVFAYDMGVSGYNNGWSDLLPNKAGDKNDHFRIWGKPIYAMADGYVLQALNDCPNNAGPIPGGLTDAQFDAAMATQKTNYWGTYENQGGGGGNHLNIRHGDVVALYAHMQKGSIPSKFHNKMAQVKRGDLLGYAGNSGNSTAPHLHIHTKTYKDDNTLDGEWFRPLLFKDGYVIGKDKYTSPMSNVAWSSLDKEGIPGLEGKACFIHPDTHPYCGYPTNWGEVTRFGVDETSYQKELDKIWTCGYYPIWVDGYDAGGKTYFNIITRPSAGVNWVARHNMDGNGYQSEYNKWDEAGYRLINIDAYKRGGNVNYAAVWVKDGGPKPMAFHGKPLAQYNAEFNTNMNNGWTPVNIAPIAVGNDVYVAGIWEKKNVGGFYQRPAMTIAQYKAFFKEYSDEKKFKLVYLNAFTLNGQPMLSGTWYKDAPNFGSWWAKHHLNSVEMQSEYNTQLGNGYLTRGITGYSDGGVQRWEAIFSK